ncbi:MAG: hypothetical protein PUF51_00015 [Bifidobacteriaceae bacterium]|nr:hypothetical protein [Bifidobacteriaceae bacterium]
MTNADDHADELQRQGPRIFRGEQGSTDPARLPWSYRHGTALAITVTIVSAVVAAVIGTMAHRAGLRHDVPYGLVLALAIMGISAWSARARTGIWGLMMHFFASLAVLIELTSFNGGRTYLMVGGTSLFPTWIGQNISYLWLYGAVFVQIVIALLPRKLFVIAPREDSVGAGDDEADDDDADNGFDSAADAGSDADADDQADVQTAADHDAETLDADAAEPTTGEGNRA